MNEYPKVNIATWHGERASLFYVMVQHSADPNDWSLAGVRTDKPNALQLAATISPEVAHDPLVKAKLSLVK